MGSRLDLVSSGDDAEVRLTETGKQRSLVLAQDRPYSDGLFFNLVTKEKRDGYAVWILADVFGKQKGLTPPPSDLGSLFKFVEENWHTWLSKEENFSRDYEFESKI